MPAQAHPPTTTPALPLLLKPSRVKATGLLCLCLAFLALAVLMVRAGAAGGRLCLGIFGLGAIIAGVNLLPGAAYLHLAPEGFTFCSLFRAHHTAWAEVSAFGLATIPGRLHRQRLVGWNYQPGVPSKGRVAAALSAQLSGYEAALPDTYGMKAEALAQLLEILRRLHAEGSL